MVDYETRVREVLIRIWSTKERMDSVSEWRGFKNIYENIETIAEVIIDVVMVIQYVDKKIDNEEKEKIAVKILNEKIKLPWYMIPFVNMFLKYTVSLVVEVIQNFVAKNKWIELYETEMSVLTYENEKGE